MAKISLGYILDEWFKLGKTLTLYKNAILGTLVSAILIGVVMGLLTIPGLLLGAINPALGGILLSIGMLAAILISVYLSQISTGVILKTIESKDMPFMDNVRFVISKKIKPMGTAALAYFVVGFGYLFLIALPFILGIVLNSPALAMMGIFIGLVGLIGMIVLVYFLWLTPIIAYYEEIGVGALRRSYDVMRRAGWTGVGVFIVITAIAWIVSTVLNSGLQMTLSTILFTSPAAGLLIIPLIAIWLFLFLVVSSIVLVIYICAQVLVYRHFSEKQRSKKPVRKTLIKGIPSRSRTTRKTSRKQKKRAKRK